MTARHNELGLELDRAITLAGRALAHWRDGRLEDCRPLALEALARLKNVCAKLEE